MRIPGSLSLSLSLCLLHWRREREERSEGVGPGWVQPPRLSFPTTRDTIWVPCRMCTVRTAGYTSNRLRRSPPPTHHRTRRPTGNQRLFLFFQALLATSQTARERACVLAPPRR